MQAFPGDKPLILKQTKSLDINGYCEFNLNAGLHIGTHIDTPMHMTKSLLTIDKYPLDNFIGEGVLLNVENQNIITYHKSYNDLVKENDIVLLYTGHSKYFKQNKYYLDYPIITNE